MRPCRVGEDAQALVTFSAIHDVVLPSRRSRQKAGQDDEPRPDRPHDLSIHRHRRLPATRCTTTPHRAGHSTVTDLARLRGWSTSQPRITATW